MTEPLLPPDPTRDGHYYLTRTGWNIGKRVETWRWCPDEPIWRNEQWGPMGPDLAGNAGYTLASPHPIPSAAQLDALHSAAGRLHSEKEAASRLCTRYVVGTVDWEREASRKAAYADAAGLIRAALKGDAP